MALLFFAWQLARKPPPFVELMFWGLLTLLLLWPGVYLEFPSDPWEHFRRIMRWNNVGIISAHEQANKFSYFFSWTLISSFAFESRRLLLGIVAAFWQFLVVLSIFRFARTFGEKSPWIYLHGLAFIFLFGTNLFGLRYYSLSSFPIAFVCYIEILTLLISHFSLREKTTPTSVICAAVFMSTAVIALNHFQEIMFLILGGSCLFAILSWNSLNAQHRQTATRAIYIVSIAGFLLGFGLKIGFADFYRVAGDYQFLANGSLKVLHNGYRYQDTLGAHGMLAVFFSIWLFKKYPLPSLLTLAPLAILVFPPVTFVYLKYLSLSDEQGGGTAYRILYAMPTSIMLVIGLRNLFEKFRPKLNPKVAFISISILVFALAWPPKKTWRGRLYFQMMQPPSEQSLIPQDQTVDWFKVNRPGCDPITDPLTGIAIEANLGYLGKADRLRKIGQPTETLPPEYFGELAKAPEACGYLTADLSRVPDSDGSYVASWSGHWQIEASKLKLITPPGLLKQVANLKALGWKVTQVPPFYELTEPAN